MKINRGLLLLLFSALCISPSMVYANLLTLNATEYRVEVKLAFHEVGDYLTTVGVIFNHSDFVEFDHISYTPHGTYRNLIAIDYQGRVTIKEKFTRDSTYNVQFIVIVAARLADNSRLAEFLVGQIQIKVKDVVYFLSYASEGVNVSVTAKAGDVVYDISTVVSVDTENFLNPVLTYRSNYSTSFLVSHNGLITMKKDSTELRLRRYCLQIFVDFILTFRNGTQINGTVYLAFYFYILGTELPTKLPTLTPVCKKKCNISNVTYCEGDVVSKTTCETCTCDPDASNQLSCIGPPCFAITDCGGFDRVVPPGECCPKCPNTPNCTFHLCKRKRNALCTISDAAGNCTNQVTSCTTAYYSVHNRPAPAKCSRKNKCTDLTGESLETCLKKWGNCVKKSFRAQYGRTPANRHQKGFFKTLEYPCGG